MNDAVYKFKRYEDGSLEYIGFDNFTKKETRRVGGWDSTLPRDVFEELYLVNQDVDTPMVADDTKLRYR
jgi:hypothetical protein